MISQTAEYALRAIVYLSEHSDGGQTTELISKATKVPTAYLSKVLQQLAREGMVKAQRGVRGGWQLCIPANKLTVLDIINTVDPITRIRECPLNLKAHATKLCSLHRRLDDAAALVEKAFGQTTIAELLADGENSNVYTFPMAINKKSKKR